MKKVMIMVSMFLMTAVMAVADTRLYDGGDIVILPGVTNIVSKEITVCDQTAPNYRDLEEFAIVNSSGTGTGTVSLIAYEIGIETTVCPTNALIPKASLISYPLRGYSNSVAYGSEKYRVRNLKIKIAQPASATSNIYRWSIKSK